MSRSAVQLFIFISCFLVADRIISGVASSVIRRMKLEKPPKKVFNLDMAPNSVDDQFIGCENDAEKRVLKKYLQKELNSNREFKRLWDKNKDFDNYVRSIRVYTAPSNVYVKLNKKMTNGRKTYKNFFRPFPFKALHFFITRAIQKFKIQACQIVYRRTNVIFKEDNLNHEIRFGRFASTSVYSNDIMKHFGNKTCFEIKTCYGADISNISYFKNEGEVLIPPYEKFKVIDIQKAPNEMECEVLYTLKSYGTCSNMNCAMLNQTSKNKCYKKKQK